MTRAIPGTIATKDRDFIYIEASSDEVFHHIVSEALSVNDEISMPASGGALEEKVRLTLDDGTSLMGISYKGDLEGWRAKLVAFCKSSGRVHGNVCDAEIVLSSGVTLPLDDIKVDFDD